MSEVNDLEESQSGVEESFCPFHLWSEVVLDSFLMSSRANGSFGPKGNG